MKNNNCSVKKIHYRKPVNIKDKILNDNYLYYKTSIIWILTLDAVLFGKGFLLHIINTGVLWITLWSLNELLAGHLSPANNIFKVSYAADLALPNIIVFYLYTSKD